MKTPRLIIFDVDGTLIDAYPAITSSFNFTMERLGYAVKPPRVIRKAVGWGDLNLLKPFVKPDDLKKALRIYRKHHRKELLLSSRLFPGVKRMLAAFKKKKYLLAIASNRPTKFTRILIKHLAVISYFDYVLCADRLKRGKPYPDIIRKIMEKLSVGPDHTIYAGDMFIDILAGRRAHVRTVAVLTGSSSRKELKKENPWKILRKITELPAYLR
ncbi:MAG: HAD family hydrolase [Candidatus Omnitrophica bacterium]|nr:HAD family hydrolase [Candidatus Omnitrophota bacterium]